MLVGDVSTFAIESHFSGRVHFGGWPWGMFVLHVAGHRYGIYKPDWSHLGRAASDVRAILRRRGSHLAPIFPDDPAIEIANAVRCGIYSLDRDQDVFLGRTAKQLSDVFQAAGCLWLDCDEAFDDGSRFVILDHAARVRLIAFTHVPSTDDLPPTVREIWLDSDNFYGTLQSWANGFEAEWAAVRQQESRLAD